MLLEDVGLVLVHEDLVAHHQDEVGLGLLDERGEQFPDAIVLGLVARDDAEQQARGRARRGHRAKRPTGTGDQATPAQDVVAVRAVGAQSVCDRDARAELELGLGAEEAEEAGALDAEPVLAGVVEGLDPRLRGSSGPSFAHSSSRTPTTRRSSSEKPFPGIALRFESRTASRSSSRFPRVTAS